MGGTVGAIVFYVILVAWNVFESVLRQRDKSYGAPETTRDRGTGLLLAVAVIIAMVAGAVLAGTLAADSPLRLPGNPWTGVAGLIVIAGGLAIRVWAVTSLGRSFKTRVAVDTDQAVISSGPYRVIRHPSYTGYLLITTGCGLLSQTWPGLILFALLPLAAMLWRIQVEEGEMTRVLGDQYSTYRARTRRLIPGLW